MLSILRRRRNGALHAQRVRFLFDQDLSGLSVSGIAALLAAILVWPMVHSVALITWLCAMLGIVLARIGLLLAWRRHRPADNRLPWWNLAYTGGAGLGGLAWGMLCLTIGPDTPSSAVLIIYLVIAGIAAAGISTNAVLLSAYLAFLLSILVPVGISQVIGAPGFDPGVAEFTPLFAVGLILTARSYSDRVVQSLGLAEDLKRANRDLEAEMTRRSEAQAEIAQTRRLFMEGSVVTFRWGAEEGWPVLSVSPNARQLGLDPERLVSERTRYADLIHPDDLDRVDTRDPDPAGPTGMPFFEMDYRICLPDGSMRWVYDHTVEVHDKEGRLAYYEGYLLDISDRKRIEEALRAEKDLAQITLHSIAEGVLRTDDRERVAYMNPAAERLTGWPLDLALGRALDEVLRFEELRGASPQPDLGRTDMGYQLLRRRDGGFFTVSHSVSAVLDDAGRACGTVWVLHDVTETRLLAEELAHQASHDALTGLLNRREFEIRLQHALYTSRTEGLRHVCLYADLDQFKIVNDTCGHSAGDALLRELAGMLQEKVRDSDALARLGGDEFGVLLQSCSVEKGRELAEQLLSQLREFRFFSDGNMFDVGASIGLAAVTPDSGRAETVLSCADLACYAAKDLGRNRVHVYQASDTDLLRRHDEMRWVTRITEALAEESLELVGQPIRPADGGGDDLLWHEALVRLRNPDGTLSEASEFLPAAERYNLAPHIDRWVVDSALSWLATRADQARRLIAINVSGVTLSDEKFLDFIRARLERFGVHPGSVCFEITETAAIANLRAASRFLGELRPLGCRFALDDFGSGLSSFAYLKNFPVDYLKVDGSFVRDMLDDPLDRAMVKAIIDVGAIMGIRTVAEHVETPDAAQALAEMGVDYVQGFGVARLMSLGAEG